ncbi:hypothetical protein FHS31_001489 [Sphingomonas vulcanisoli]|uniref:Colicin transporter n=1 Tax=Sphingomonas vulcanisoli TaxID=1658060 RepID=A0ABX0TUN9_9SPHN|nr:hypothetical protein [Sphingomonas vulcanisoli]NIJ07879.1 hypothetical protein [Sphingomonas vulcanisoli]
MIAARFRLIAWVAGCAFAALLCYMASQSVAAERGALLRVDGQIADTQNDIRRLETEIAARSRMGQLERWNQVLALQAARPVQYVANEVQLASLAGGPKRPLEGNIQMAAYQKSAPAAAPQPAPAQAPAPAIQQPMLRVATYVQDKPGPLAADAPAPVVKASLEKPAAKSTAPKPERSTPAKLTLASFEEPAHKAATADDPVPAKPKRKAVKVDDSLLPSDLGSLIAAEKKGAHKRAAL